MPRRLDKYLRDATALSVVEIRKACHEGRVCVGDVRSVAEALIFEDDYVRLDGAHISPKMQHLYLLLNKPRFITATVRDPRGKTDLGPWLQQMPPGVFPVGRLDRETSGALLFSDDGDFANAILQPGRHTEKLYWLWLDEHLGDDDPRLTAFVDGVQLPTDSAPLRATAATVHHRTLDYTELHVTLDEGKNRHIRKMCNMMRLRLLELHRKAIGSIGLGALRTGQWRQLNASEVEELWSSCGGRARVTRTKMVALTQLAQSAREDSSPNERLEAWLGRHCGAEIA